MPLSAVDCVQPAIQHAREQLFRRFRFGQWSRLALVAILAAELHVSGCNFGNFGSLIPPQDKGGNEFLTRPIPHIDPARIAQFAGLIIAAVLVAIVVGFIFLYINSVFRFILFDSVVRRECSIGDGWQRWHRAGRRYFLWQVVFQISIMLFLFLLVGIPLLLAASAGWFKDSAQHVGGMVGGVVLLVGCVLIFALVIAVIQVLAKDFLVPLMALENLDFADGWSRLIGMMRVEPGSYIVYLLLKLALAIAAAILFGIIAIIPILAVIVPSVLVVVAGKASGMGWNAATVSLLIIFGVIAIALLVYLVAMVSVPAAVFFPAYALYFLAGRYPTLAALLTPTPVPPASELPPVMESPPQPPPPLPPSPEPIG